MIEEDARVTDWEGHRLRDLEAMEVSWVRRDLEAMEVSWVMTIQEGQAEAMRLRDQADLEARVMIESG